MTDTVVLRRGTNSAWIGLNRPERHNALDYATSQALGEAVATVERQGPCVLILHSTTPGMFVAGTDIADLAKRRIDDALAPINVRLFDQIANFRWPTIAVVDGPAFGGGCELALACDLRVASSSARFAQPEPSLGILAGAGANWRLPALVGVGLARRMLYAGDIVEADEALAAGLVDRLTDAETLMEVVDELVKRIAARSWRALELTKLALRSQRAETTAFDLVAQGLLYESDDKTERMRAFLDRGRA
ncbi:MAG TPA: enoyl-CoA hydratase/isomerase family protein [Micromonosporaceae bacterium]